MIYTCQWCDLKAQPMSHVLMDTTTVILNLSVKWSKCNAITTAYLLLGYFDAAGKDESVICCIFCVCYFHYERHGVSHHRQLDYLFNSVFRRITCKTSQARIAGYLWSVTGGFPYPRAGNVKLSPFLGCSHWVKRHYVRMLKFFMYSVKLETGVVHIKIPE